MKIYKEINWGLHEVIRFKSKYGLNIRKPYLDKTLTDSLIYSNTCIVSNMLKYNFITVKKEEVFLTDKGEEMINFATDRYELSDNQRSLVMKLYLEVNSDMAKRWFSKFLNEEICAKRDEIDLTLQQFSEDMIQFGIARQVDELLYINKEYYQLMQSLTSKGMTEGELFGILENNKRLGDLAERIAVEYEKNRLINAGNNELAQKVKLISKSEVNAGYDIRSYKNANSKKYDAYIEVKYFNNNQFYLSQNEYLTAETLKEDYYLYLVNTETEKIQVINNPFKKLKEISKSIEVVSTKYTL